MRRMPFDPKAATDVYLAALGNGETEYAAMFRSMADAYPERVSVHIGYDEPAAHRVGAAVQSQAVHLHLRTVAADAMVAEDRLYVALKVDPGRHVSRGASSAG